MSYQFDQPSGTSRDVKGDTAGAETLSFRPVPKKWTPMSTKRRVSAGCKWKLQVKWLPEDQSRVISPSWDFEIWNVHWRRYLSPGQVVRSSKYHFPLKGESPFILLALTSFTVSTVQLERSWKVVKRDVAWQSIFPVAAFPSWLNGAVGAFREPLWIRCSRFLRAGSARKTVLGYEGHGPPMPGSTYRSLVLATCSAFIPQQTRNDGH